MFAAAVAASSEVYDHNIASGLELLGQGLEVVAERRYVCIPVWSMLKEGGQVPAQRISPSQNRACSLMCWSCGPNGLLQEA
jgi:hypothetical protein